MLRAPFQRWLENYGRAWEQRDARAAVKLYAPGATYQQTPFVEAMCGREAILHYWVNVCRTQEDVHYGFEILEVGEETGLAHWWANFVRLPRRNRIALDGIFLVALDADGLCTSLREWWHRKEF